jgi:hypothetical protein
MIRIITHYTEILTIRLQINDNSYLKIYIFNKKLDRTFSLLKVKKGHKHKLLHDRYKYHHNDYTSE